MRVFIAVSCFLALASAGYYDGAPAHGGQYQGPIHIPVLDHNGVPVEPKEVQEARKNHLAAFAGVQPAPAHNYGYSAHQQQYQQPQYNQQQYQQSQYSNPQHQYQQQQQHVPVIDAHGVPQDAPDVAAAKAAHFAAYAQVNERAAPASAAGSGHNYGYSAPQHQYQFAAPQHQYQQQQQQHVPVIDVHGVPQDAPDVAAAKAAHFAAYAQANARTAPAPGHYQHAAHYAPAPAHYGPAGHAAGPIDTPEVAAAKAAHFAAHAQVAQPQQQQHHHW